MEKYTTRHGINKFNETGFMVKYIIGDWFDCSASFRAHGCNCFHTFGSGLAKDVKRIWPQVYQADIQTKLGCREKMGSFSYGKLEEDELGGERIIFNCYTQFNVSNKYRVCDYEAIIKCFKQIKEKIINYNKLSRIYNNILAVPFLYNCGKAGGDWHIVESIFQSIFNDATVNLHIMVFEVNYDKYSNFIEEKWGRLRDSVKINTGYSL